MNPRSITGIVSVTLLLTVLQCSSGIKDEITKALNNSKIKDAQKIARKKKHAARYLSEEVIFRSAVNKDTKPIAISLIMQSGREIIPILKRLKGEKCERLKTIALLKLHKFGTYGALSELEKYLESPKGLVRASAVEGFLMENQNAGFYEKYLRDPEVEVRRAVINSLSSIAAKWAHQLIYEAAKYDPASSIRATAVRFLEPAGEKNLELFKNIVEKDEKEVKIPALITLAENPATANLNWMSEYTNLPVTEEGIYYATGLLKHEETAKRAVAYLVHAVKNQSPTIRGKLLTALMEQRVILTQAKSLYEDKNPEVRLKWSIYCRINSINKNERIDVLKHLAKLKGDISIRALIALTEEKSVKYHQIRGSLWQKMKKGDIKSKKYILSYAGRTFSDPSLSFEFMSDPDPVIRLYSAIAYLRDQF